MRGRELKEQGDRYEEGKEGVKQSCTDNWISYRYRADNRVSQ